MELQDVNVLAPLIPIILQKMYNQKYFSLMLGAGLWRERKKKL